MNEKKQRIIEEGMRLFAKQGFHNTSIQQIAQQSGVSKGGFYLHFKSKEELILSIFKFYYEKTMNKINAVESEGLTPKAQLEKQLYVYFEDFLQQREFILVKIRENFSINDELDAFLLHIRRELMEWYEVAIVHIYGDEVKENIVDCVVLLEGLIAGYFHVLLIESIKVDIGKLANFIIARLDDMMVGIKQQKPSALLTKEKLLFIYKSTGGNESKEEIEVLLKEAEEVIKTIKISKGLKEDCLTTIKYLIKEIQKEKPQKIVFQGLLTNLNGIEELSDIRDHIAYKMGIPVS